MAVDEKKESFGKRHLIDGGRSFDDLAGGGLTPGLMMLAGAHGAILGGCEANRCAR